MIVAAALAGALHLIPAPQTVRLQNCTLAIRSPLRLDRGVDDGALTEISERWRALGIPVPVRAKNADVRVRYVGLPWQAYRLNVGRDGVEIDAGSSDGVFYAAMTLAQLPQRASGVWQLPCVRIGDAPALKWRVLSDDVSRGPLPTMRYFKERIRTIAAFKMNGYSPYMEHVFVDPQDPLPAPLDGITPEQLQALNAYAARFHVTLILEQQTFAHMHNTLRVEKYACAAEEPHSFLLSPASPLSFAYISRLVADELRAVPHPPFFHIGSDETSALGQGKSAALVAARGRGAVYAEHIALMNRIVKPSGARIMLWDDAIENDPSIMSSIPKDAVVINWHYGNDRTFAKYIAVIQSGGLDQMIAPGDSNWNQVYPDIVTALRNEQDFIQAGKQARVLGLFQTVWHDDGESLFEATWYPVIFAAAAGWEQGPVEPQRFEGDFPFAFFGTDDGRYGQDIVRLGTIQHQLADAYDYTSNYLMWVDPFDTLAQTHMQSVDIPSIRLSAEAVEEHLLHNVPPLHAGASRVMFLAARKYDFIGRKFQAAQEIRGYYS
ncbi:MAG TPA: glycoside hydrolase family 20 zincin-like fold domain-containing protein, partial [Candidatus Baltobacteraceae bacterium]|nr:glycoside hydrolase family 20 zincin-like fold domain-containing protein [Candidatus Baltobacteraceae bacterium]